MRSFIHYMGEDVTLYHGDALEVVRTLPSESVNCVVTSPPYFGLRDYGSDGQYGTEASPAEYVETMRALFSELRRALADDGTLWLNLGDSYYSGKGSPTQPDLKNEARRPASRSLDKPGQKWARPKNLLGIPWRVAFALQDDGWNLRNDIIWTKPNGMPDPARDRLGRKHEHVFLLTKSKKYYFDLDAIREPHTCDRQHGKGPRSAGGTGRNDSTHGTVNTQGHPSGKNPGDVWSINTRAFPEAHFATFPPELARRCVLAGCPEGGTVLDPFSGSGTTGMVALEQGKKYIGIDLNSDYLDLSLRTRLRGAI